MPNPRSGTRGVPRPEREASILTAATVEFGLHGYQGASMAAIAKRADVSKSLVLTYFGSKDALYLRCVDEVAARLLGPVGQVVAFVEPGMLMALQTLRTIFDALEERPRDWNLIHDLTVPKKGVVLERVTSLRQEFAALGATGVQATLDLHCAGTGQRDPMDAAALNHLWTDVVDSAMRWWLRHPEETPESLSSRFARIVASLVNTFPADL